ncbi:M16 family metallopeptidase [Filimonas effusa]|uniref:Insulinase family protein n=1 Tax=Filimonas effusa TaxID=2508721 RepID=A0A4Q1D7V1_9BACT|nr:pitrilysin family protein [Filimonas effusa]RXK83841.1 insulinase family protein [Filimonas effusa]
MINRKKSPAIHDAVEFDLKLKACDHFTLDNGVHVYAVDAGAQEVMQLEWVFYAGNCFEDQNIVAATTNFLLKNGTSTKSAFEINEHFEFYGAYLNRHCYNETATVTLHCLTKHLPVLLPEVAALFTSAEIPEEELAIYKQNQKQRLEVNLKKCDFVANRLIDEYLFGLEHPYGKYSSTKDYDALERDQLKAFYKRFYTEGKCIMFVAGKLPANLQEQLNNAFGQLPFRQSGLPVITYPGTPATEKKYNIINDNDGVQGAIRMAIPFPNRHHPDFIKVQVLNNIFGGFFGSRLMSNIREDKGYTYGIHSYLQNHIHQSAWMISTEAGRDVCAATIEEVYKEMLRLTNEPVEKDELDLVRNYMMGSILGDLDGPFQIIGRWKNYVLNNLTDAYFYNSLETIRSITAEELQELAKKYLVPETFYELVVV